MVPRCVSDKLTGNLLGVLHGMNVPSRYTFERDGPELAHFSLSDSPRLLTSCDFLDDMSSINR